MALQDTIEKINAAAREARPGLEIDDYNDDEFTTLRTLSYDDGVYTATFRGRNNIRLVQYFEERSMFVVLNNGKEYLFSKPGIVTFRKLIAHQCPEKYLNKLFYSNLHMRVKRKEYKVECEEVA